MWYYNLFEEESYTRTASFENWSERFLEFGIIQRFSCSSFLSLRPSQPATATTDDPPVLNTRNVEYTAKENITFLREFVTFGMVEIYWTSHCRFLKQPNFCIPSVPSHHQCISLMPNIPETFFHQFPSFLLFWKLMVHGIWDTTLFTIIIIVTKLWSSKDINFKTSLF